MRKYDNKMWLDFSGELDYAYILHLWGGKEKIEKEYPEVFRILRNTRKRMLNLQNRRAVKTTGTTDFEDDAKIPYINFNAKSLEAASSIHLTEPSPILLINGQLEDVTRLDDMELASAIGWLAREDKIQFEFDKERGLSLIHI